MGACTLHAMNLMFAVPIEKIMGGGTLKKQRFLQMLHAAYTLKNLFPQKTWSDIWDITTETTWKGMSCPVLSRWEHVGETANHIKDNYENWTIISQYIINKYNAGTNRNDIASYLNSYLKEGMLHAQLEFVCAFVNEIYDHHFQCQKHKDSI